MSFLAGMGGPLAGALGGAISPVSGLGMAGGPMSGIGLLSKLFGGKGEGEGDTSPTPAAAPVAQPEALQPNFAAKGLGSLLGADPAKISSIANSLGSGMNQIAQAGGAQGGYAPAPELPAINNHMQMMDPKILQALVQYFGGGNR